MINAPSGGAPEKAPRWDLSSTEGCGGGLGFRGAPGCLRGTWTYIGGRSRSVEEREAHEGGGRAQGGRRAPLPRGLLDCFLTPTPSLLDHVC